jgi:hypothetical protein
MPELDQDQMNEMFEIRISQIERYLQSESHDITKYDGQRLPPQEPTKSDQPDTVEPVS